MFIEQDASFKLPIPANQHRRTPFIFHGICSDEIFRLRGEIIFLATAAPEFANLSQAGVQFPIAHHQSQVSCVIGKNRNSDGIAGQGASIPLLAGVN
jgi:hypothetical protein